MRVLVTGGRTFKNYRLLKATLDKLNITHIINGGASGADELATTYAYNNKIPYTVRFADWDAYGKAAGARRNIEMLRTDKPDLVVVFEGGAGTEHMCKAAKRYAFNVLDTRTLDI